MPDTVTIPAALDFTAAAAQQALLVQACATGNLRLDLTPGQPSASAVQLLMAAAKTLIAQDRFNGFGPHAAQYLDPNSN